MNEQVWPGQSYHGGTIRGTWARFFQLGDSAQTFAVVMAKKPTVQSPIPTVQVINDPRPPLPKSRARPVSGQRPGKTEQDCKSQRQTEEELQGMQKKPAWENVGVFNACTLFCDGGVGAEKGHWGSWWRASATVTQEAWRVWGDMGFSTVGPALGKVGALALKSWSGSFIHPNSF